MKRIHFRRFLGELFRYFTLWYAFGFLDTDDSDRVEPAEYKNGFRKFRQMLGLGDSGMRWQDEFEEIANGQDVVSWKTLCDWYDKKLCRP